MILLMLLFSITVPETAVSEGDLPSEGGRPRDRSLEIQELREQLAQLRNVESTYSRARDMGRLEAKVAPLAKAISRRETEAKKNLLRVAELERAIKEAQHRLSRSQRALEGARSVRKIRFIPHEKGQKIPIFVECQETTMMCGIAGRGLQATEFSLEPLEAFVEHAKRFSPNSHFFVFLIKPSAHPSVMGAVRRVKLLGFEIGYDALEEENHVDFTGSR